MKLLWRLIRTQLRPHLRGMIAMIAIAVVVAATPYAFTMLGRWVVDDVLQVTAPPKTAEASEGSDTAAADPSRPRTEWLERPPEQKLRLLGVFFAVCIGVHLLATGLSVASERINARVVHHVIYRMRSTVHEKLVSMATAAFSREQVGQLMTRVLDDVAGIPGNLTHFVINTCTQAGMLILAIVLLVHLNPSMTLLVLAVLPFYGITCFVFLPRIRKNTERLRVHTAQFNGFTIERLANVATIKNYAQEDRETEAFGGVLNENIALARRQYNLNLLFGTLTAIVTGCGTLGVLALGFLNIKQGTMLLGEALAFYGVTAQLFVPISVLVGMGAVAQTLQVLGSRVYAIVDTPQGVRDSSRPINLPRIHGAVAFESVSLRYEEGGPFAVHDVNLKIPAGATVCIVGPTGCGKSTLLTLLSRLYDPTDGVVRLDGVDIRRIPLATLRHRTAHVRRDCQVFTGMFHANISYGVPDAPLDRVEQAAKVVGLHEFIQSQPRLYRAKLGRGGLTLEAEQLTRLAFARAVLVSPAVLAVDDAYAAIEEDLERPLRAAVRQALPGCTIIMATSRLSVCEDADMVVVMRNGEVVEQGTHSELMAVPGVYRRMYVRQMGMGAPAGSCDSAGAEGSVPDARSDGSAGRGPAGEGA